MELEKWFDEWIATDSLETFDEFCDRKRNTKNPVLVQGAFNQLFSPSLREAIMSASTITQNYGIFVNSNLGKANDESQKASALFRNVVGMDQAKGN